MDLNHEPTEAAKTADSPVTANAEPQQAPVRRRASRRVTAAAGEAVAPIEAVTTEVVRSAETVTTETVTADSDEAPKKRVSRARKKVETPETSDAAVAEPLPPATEDSTQDHVVTTATAQVPSTAPVVAGEETAPRKRNTRGRKTAAERAEAAAEGAAAAGTADQTEASDTQEASDASEKGEKQDANGRDPQARSSRTRQRERKRRGTTEDGEPEITEDDVLLPIAGILDVLDNYAFVRTSGYLPGTSDVYVSLGQVKKYGLRKGDAVVGAIRQPREGENHGRQKYNAIVKVDSVNTRSAEDQQARPEFADLTPVHPSERLRLETKATELGSRIVDLFSPVGKGQRGLIIGPHESGKSALLQEIAHAVAQNQPDAHLMLVLVDERPEVVTQLQRTINGEVIASTFDKPAEDHTTIAELAVERAKRLVELGHDVVVLIDSLTDLARAYNLAAPASVRVPAGSLDAAAVFPVKRLLSAARNIENGGSLTILATVSAQPDSLLDDALIGELEAVANMQVRLSGVAADQRVFPAIDLARSSTRNESMITSEAEVRVMNQLRRNLLAGDQLHALDSVLQQLGRTSSNVEFLAVTQRQQAGA